VFGKRLPAIAAVVTGFAFLALSRWADIATVFPHYDDFISALAARLLVWWSSPHALIVTGKLLIGSAVAVLLLGAAISYLIFALLRRNQRFRQEARTDPLTQVLNLLGLQEGLPGLQRYTSERRRELKRRHNTWTDQDGPFVFLIFIDIAGFREMNLDPGYHKANIALREIAHLFESEKKSTDLFGRWGGDEFVWMMVAEPKEVFFAVRARQRRLDRDGIAVDEGKPIKLYFRCGVTRVAESESFVQACKRASEVKQRLDPATPIDPEKQDSYYKLAESA
jgi:diguanylate cyclase (GGDEF)-like protein